MTKKVKIKKNQKGELKIKGNVLDCREKFIMYGGETLNEVELLSLILQTGSKKLSVNLLATKLIEKYHTLDMLLEQPLKELQSNDGIGEVKAIKIKSLYHIYNKMNNSNMKKKITCANDIYVYLKQYENQKEENFYILGLNTNNEILGIRHIFKGSINYVNISLREVFKEALFLDSQCLCLVHNHPSGNVCPSTADVHVTKEIIKFGKILNVAILDHIIIGKGKYFSLKENEVIEF